MMSNIVHCKKLNQDLEGFDTAPYPGELGEEILKSISKQAWSEWLNHQTMLINEYRLNLIEPAAQKFLEKEMKSFLFPSLDSE